jgi:syntaxin of plants SYP7
LKDIAIEMGKEATKQTKMIEIIGDKTDKANEQLENLNDRLRKVIQSIRKGDRFVMDIILLCILLGIAGYIYKMFKG